MYELVLADNKQLSYKFLFIFVFLFIFKANCAPDIQVTSVYVVNSRWWTTSSRNVTTKLKVLGQMPCNEDASITPWVETIDRRTKQ